MKKRLFSIIIVSFTLWIVLSGCSSPATDMHFALEPPGCTATWDVNNTWVAWSYVEGADYYIVYCKQYYPDTESPIPDLSIIPRDLSTYEELVSKTTMSSFTHKTLDDFCYAVKAFTNDGKSSDYSNIAFTWGD